MPSKTEAEDLQDAPEANPLEANRTEREHLQAWLADLQQRQAQLANVQARLAWLEGWLAATEGEG